MIPKGIFSIAGYECYISYGITDGKTNVCLAGAFDDKDVALNALTKVHSVLDVGRCEICSENAILCTLYGCRVVEVPIERIKELHKNGR